MDNSVLINLQKVELDILCMIDKFCYEHEIEYSLYAGTALGAVRHGGFIPWDDDIDIAMTRIEFDKFCKKWMTNPVRGYYLESILTDENCGTCHAKVRKDGTIFLSKGECENSGHHGIWVDVFPLDKVSLNKKIRDKKYKIGREIIFLTRANVDNTQDSIDKKFIRQVIRVIPHKIRAKRIINLHKWLVDHIDDGNEEGFEWKSMSTLENIAALHFYSTLDEGYTSIKFENIDFRIFKHYEDMLKCNFGDYMTLPPEAKRVCKHNPIRVQFDN